MPLKTRFSTLNVELKESRWFCFHSSFSFRKYRELVLCVRGFRAELESGSEGYDSKVDTYEPYRDRDRWKSKYRSNEPEDIFDESQECVDDQNDNDENYPQDGCASYGEGYVKIRGYEDPDAESYQRGPADVAERTREEENSEHCHDNQVVLQVWIQTCPWRESNSENARENPQTKRQVYRNYDYSDSYSETEDHQKFL